MEVECWNGGRERKVRLEEEGRGEAAVTVTVEGARAVAVVAGHQRPVCGPAR